MADRFILADFVVDILRAAKGEKYTALEVANFILEDRRYRSACENKAKQSSNTTMWQNGTLNEKAIVSQISAEIAARKEKWAKHNIRMTLGRPRRYYFSMIEAEEAKESIAEDYSSPSIFEEKDLYIKLGIFLYNEYNIVSKRINEKESRNDKGRQGNKWLFADVVALQRLGLGWSQEVNQLVKSAGDKKFKLWSFEVKKFITMSNVREVYFQAVSNSSWANFGYLVAVEIDDEVEEELRMLVEAYGIGILKLDKDSPIDSEIIFPAQEKNKINWTIVNRIVEQQKGKGFDQYIKTIDKMIKGDAWADDDMNRDIWNLTPRSKEIE